jgi:hypothetical protein
VNVTIETDDDDTIRKALAKWLAAFNRDAALKDR